VRLLSGREPAAFVKAINEIYNPDTPEKLELLLSILRRYVPGQGFLYFWGKWYGITYKKNMNMLVALTILGEWDEACKGYILRYEATKNELYKIMISALCIAAKGKTETVPAHYLVKPESEQYPAVIFNALTTYGATENVMAAVSGLRDAQTVQRVGNLLYELCFFAEARDILIKSTECSDANTANAASCNNSIGICSFLTGDYEAARKYFEKARSLGVNENSFKIFHKIMNGEKPQGAF
jgi:tetratricopeptide (TPR) repeat protein